LDHTKCTLGRTSSASYKVADPPLAGDPLALSGDVIGRTTVSVPGSNESLCQIRKWLEECESNHAECASPFIHQSISVPMVDGSESSQSGNTLPSRLINVGPGKESCSPFLWETEGKKGRYAVLSYSWGRSSSFKTKKSTYNDRLKGFDVAQLPNTIRDAVFITRELGLQFLWVDALCIIQDDDADWATESARMDGIYGNAVITIAAAASKDKWEGCFRNASPAATQTVALTSQCSNGSGIGVMFISSRIGSVNEVLERSQLCSRAWTLQERACSRRSINFAQDQLYWECQRHCTAEDGMVFTERSAINKCLSTISVLPTKSRFSSVMTCWHWLVTEYSQRELFAKSDKLPAISGLASQIQRHTGAQYLAGLWREDLPRAFLWHISSEDTSAPATKWRSPSWSWASIDGPLTSQGLSVGALTSRETLEELIILSFKVDILNKNNMFGEVRSAEITVNGRLRPTRRALQKHQFDYGGWIGNISPGYPLDEYDETGCSIGKCYPDFIDAPPEFYCLLVHSGTKDIGRGLFALVHYFICVVEVREAGTYKRIGAGYLAGEGQFESYEPTTLRLV